MRKNKMNFDDLIIKSKRELKVMERGFVYDKKDYDLSEMSISSVDMTLTSMTPKYLYIEVFP